MPYALTCPNCSVKLKTPNAIPHGRTVPCPKCKANIVVDATNLQEITSTGTTAAAPPPLPKPAPAADGNPFAGMDSDRGTKSKDDDDDAPRSRRRGRDEEEDETPRSRRRPANDEDDDKPRSRRGRDEDDEDDKPRSKRAKDEDDEDKPRSRRGRDEDEDDKPRSRRGRDEDEEDKPRSKRGAAKDDDEDDKPRSKRRGAAKGDEDDDKPRSRRGAARDDDDDYDARGSGRRKKQKGNKGMMIAMIAGGLLLVGGLIFLLIWLFSGGGYDKEMMAYMPEDTTTLVGVNVEDLMNVDKIKEQVDKALKQGEVADMVKKTGVSVTDISKVIVGANTKAANKGGGPPEGVAVIRFKKSIEIKKLADAAKAKENKHKDKAYYTVEGIHFFSPSDDLLVGAVNESTLKKLIEKDNSDIKIKSDLNELASTAGKGTIWAATIDSQGAGIGRGGLPFGPGGEMKGAAFWAKIDSSTADIGIAVMLKDSSEASKAAADGNKELKAGKDQMAQGIGMFLKDSEQQSAAKDAINSIDISSSGAILTVTGSIKYTPFLKELDKLGGFPGGGFPF